MAITGCCLWWSADFLAISGCYLVTNFTKIKVVCVLLLYVLLTRFTLVCSCVLLVICLLMFLRSVSKFVVAAQMLHANVL